MESEFWGDILTEREHDILRKCVSNVAYAAEQYVRESLSLKGDDEVIDNHWAALVIAIDQWDNVGEAFMRKLPTPIVNDEGAVIDMDSIDYVYYDNDDDEFDEIESGDYEFDFDTDDGEDDDYEDEYIEDLFDDIDDDDDDDDDYDDDDDTDDDDDYTPPTAGDDSAVQVA